MPLFDVTVDDPDQASKHRYVALEAEDEDAARYEAARRSIIDDPRGVGLATDHGGEWTLQERRDHAAPGANGERSDLVLAVALYAVAKPASVPMGGQGVGRRRRRVGAELAESELPVMVQCPECGWTDGGELALELCDVTGWRQLTCGSWEGERLNVCSDCRELLDEDTVQFLGPARFADGKYVAA